MNHSSTSGFHLIKESPIKCLLIRSNENSGWLPGVFRISVLIELYGETKGREVRYAEAFEGCEYGAGFSKDDIPALFPFFG